MYKQPSIVPFISNVIIISMQSIQRRMSGIDSSVSLRVRALLLDGDSSRGSEVDALFPRATPNPPSGDLALLADDGFLLFPSALERLAFSILFFTSKSDAVAADDDDDDADCFCFDCSSIITLESRFSVVLSANALFLPLACCCCCGLLEAFVVDRGPFFDIREWRESTDSFLVNSDICILLPLVLVGVS